MVRFRFSQSSRVRPIRYYLYISDSKLEILFEQIEKDLLKRISTEVKVDLKLASLTLRRAENPGPTRGAKLQIVERFLETHHRVGTVQESGAEYFRGQMDMQWGFVGDEAVCFKGHDSEQLYVCLVGSRHHVLGESPSNARSTSQLPGIMDTIARVSERPALGDDDFKVGVSA